MSVRLLTTDDDLRTYEEWVRMHPHGSLWQSIVRKKYLEACGKETRIYVAASGPSASLRTSDRVAGSNDIEATALVVIDRTTGGYSTWEVPRGPLWTSDEPIQALLDRIVEDAKSERCITLYLSPPIALAARSSQLTGAQRHVHCEATRIIDLTKSEEEILAQMHPKGRYNINVARRHGVTVTEGSVDDIDAFYDLLQSTAGRDGFAVSQKSHYTRFLLDLEGSFILMAKHAEKPIAGLIGVKWGNSGIYYYGASSHEDRQLMAPYLLQWEAMSKCKSMGCERYDLLGIEEGSGVGGQVSGKWKGISEFKRKFGGAVITYPPERMLVLRPVVKKVLEWKRGIVG
jgi:lipid II:glycine glycyltransferase (peptidoglycan interpeptide bridge formation enzyme)